MPAIIRKTLLQVETTLIEGGRQAPTPLALSLQASFAELWSDEGVRQRVFLFQIWDSIERLWQSPSPAPAAPTAQRRWSRRRA